MLKKYRRWSIHLLFALIGVFCITLTGSPTSFAANFTIQAGGTPTLTLALADGTTPIVGRTGTQVKVTGQSFTSNGTVNLYLVTDVGQCTSGGTTIPFSSKPTITADANGGFTFNAPWPKEANNAATAYYFCATPASATQPYVYSAQSFTVSPDPTANLTPNTANPGDTITITGDNWTPSQTVNIDINPAGDSYNAVQSKKNVPVDGQGHFSTMIKLDATKVVAGTYDLHVTSTKDKNITYVGSAALTVQSQATPTPTPAPTATPTPAPTDTATAAPAPTSTATAGNSDNNNGSGGSGNSGITILIFTLGGIGVALVIVGLIMFVSSGSTRTQ